LVQYEHLINIKGVKGLNEVSAQNGTIKIGALCTHHQLERSAILRNQLPTLVKLEQNVANVRVRHAGTIGGNLCFAEPHADPGTLLLALNATMVVEKVFVQKENSSGRIFRRRL